MKCEIREICGDWALDVFDGSKVTIYFNSRQNALNVKRILEVDDRIPNAATVCDMVEVVRCGKCKHSVFPGRYGDANSGIYSLHRSLTIVHAENEKRNGDKPD